jgi:calpain-7
LRQRELTVPASADFDADAAWDRIKKAFDFGDVMITLGTGHITPEEQGSLGLVGEHDYAVLDLETGSDSRRLLLKNPWFDGLAWTGAGSIAEQETNPRCEHGLTGIFWMTLEDVGQNFESMYLNWNPSLFTDRRDHHFSWDMPGPTFALTLAPNPQFAFRAGRDGSVWILLSRHFLDDELAIARRRSVSSSATMAAVSSRLGFIRLYLFDKSDGKRVLLPDGAVQRGPWVDSPQTLLRLEAKANTTYTIVAGQEGLPLPKYTFSLSFFSRGPLSAQPAAEPLPYVAETLGAWTRRCSGGNSSTSSYFDNPQYRISVRESTPITLLLATADANLPIHISLVWAKGQRVVSLASRDIVATSGEYRRGVALCRIPAPTNPGDYTAVISTFDKGSLADFTLRAAANCPVEVTPIAADGADRFRKSLPPLNFPSGESQQQPRTAWAALHVSVTTKIILSIIRISLEPSSTVRPGSTAVRASLETGQGIHRRTLAATGTELGSDHDEPDFLDATMGLRTPETHVHVDDAQRAGGIWILVELMGRPVSDQGLRVEVLSDMPVDVGSWEYLNG